ncbi:hypothetical protein JCM10212_002499 [Sporobolomyces blumeae]
MPPTDLRLVDPAVDPPPLLSPLTASPLVPSPAPPVPPHAPTNASSSSYQTASSSSSRAPSPAPYTAIRSRKLGSGARPPPPLASSEPASAFDPAFDPRALKVSPGSVHDDDADVTRPGLRRATKDALGSIAKGASDSFPPHDDYVVRQPTNKDKEREDRRVATDVGPPAGPEREREVVVHTVLKTDTVASVSLQYGISQQALRKANRLWPTDPVHFRPTLLIPLDECNLPSSSFGLERIAREENGDITVWRRESATSTSDARVGSADGLGKAAGRVKQEAGIVSPRARKLVSTPTNAGSHPSAAASTNDFLAIWDSSPQSSARPSLDSVRSVSTSSSLGPSFSPQVSAYLSTTNNPYSSSPSLEPSPPMPTSDQLVSLTNGSSPPPLVPLSPDQSTRPSSSAASKSLSPPPSNTTSPPPSDPGLSKRTLKIERLPASQLSFFPPSSTSNASAPGSLSSSPSKHLIDGATRSREPSSHAGPYDSGTTTTNRDSEDLFFGPLTNSLASSFSSLGLDKFLPTPFASSTLTSTPSGSPRRHVPKKPSKSGPIALPVSRIPSPLPSSNSFSSSLASSGSSQKTVTRSNSMATMNGSRARESSDRAGRGGGGWSSRWNLDFFGAEAEEVESNRLGLRPPTSTRSDGTNNRDASPSNNTNRLTKSASFRDFRQSRTDGPQADVDGRRRRNRTGGEVEGYVNGSGARRGSAIGLEEVQQRGRADRLTAEPELGTGWGWG